MSIIRKIFGVEDNFQFSVEIYKSVSDRIFKNVSMSKIEEGGKFLGNIYEQGNQIIVKVYSYVDAGPNVDNSSSHLFPDGEHQENLFRIIEGYDPNIEHIGSWHSHHCNRLKELSKSDIEGYIETVNARSYNLNWFFVMLVTHVYDQGFEALYYIFHRKKQGYYSIPSDQIKFSAGEYFGENMLKEVERLTYAYRNQAKRDERNTNTLPSNLDMEDKIRADDNNWLKRTYPNVQAIRNKKDGRVSWRWVISVKHMSMEVTYKYVFSDYGNLERAALSIKYNSNEILNDEIDLDNFRYQKIMSHIEKAKNLLEN